MSTCSTPLDAENHNFFQPFFFTSSASHQWIPVHREPPSGLAWERTCSLAPADWKYRILPHYRGYETRIACATTTTPPKKEKITKNSIMALRHPLEKKTMYSYRATSHVLRMRAQVLRNNGCWLPRKPNVPTASRVLFRSAQFALPIHVLIHVCA
jgi:hypothetical protein